MFDNQDLKDRAKRLYPDIFDGTECWGEGWGKIRKLPKAKQKEVITKFFGIFPNGKDLIKGYYSWWQR